MQQAASGNGLRVLILEDAATDAELAEYELRSAHIAFTSMRVETRDAFIQALEEFRPDIILSDYKLPDFNGLEALEIVQRQHANVPVVIVTGALPDIEAVELIHAGAKDYVLKDRLARLAPAVQRALAVERDARARRDAEQALKESEEKYRSIFEGSNDAIMLLTETGFFDCNTRALEMFGANGKDELVNHHPAELSAPVQPDGRDSLNALNELIRTAFKDGACRFEWLHRRRNGDDFPAEVLLSAFDLHGQQVLQAIVRDITERKQAEKELQRLNRALRALGAGNHALVHADNEQTLLGNMCRAVTDAGYLLAWVGYAMHDEKKSVVPMAMAGEGRDYVESLNLTWADEPLGRGPTGRAVRTGEPQFSLAIPRDPSMTPWQGAAAQAGFNSSIALPLKDDGKVIGALMIYSAEPGAFGPNQVELLEEMAGDLAFGIVNLRTRSERDHAVKDRQRYVDRLRASLEETLQAISATMELRDPYTAGHQRRVAQLASTIAAEMGMPDEQVHGIYLAGIVHDLGKIRVPSDILTKPGRLSDIEYSLIKIHSQAGYDILKEIEFPWPIAQAVLQHHERLDGSGYPNGLTADEILLEAKIIGVADVVEAMLMHRPYRPALGLEVALEEIAKLRGTLYDPVVVDTCLALFQQQGFKFD